VNTGSLVNGRDTTGTMVRFEFSEITGMTGSFVNVEITGMTGSFEITGMTGSFVGVWAFAHPESRSLDHSSE
jgi:hypothetical protein